MGSHFGVGAPPILVYSSGDWDVHWGYGLLTHGHTSNRQKTGVSMLDRRLLTSGNAVGDGSGSKNQHEAYTF